MSEKKFVEKPSLNGMDPTQQFWLAISVGNLDGSLADLGGEGVEGLFESETEAVAELVSLNDQYPTLEGYVFHCVPVKRIWRGKTRVDPAPKKFPPQPDRAASLKLDIAKTSKTSRVGFQKRARG